MNRYAGIGGGMRCGMSSDSHGHSDPRTDRHRDRADRQDRAARGDSLTTKPSLTLADRDSIKHISSLAESELRVIRRKSIIMTSQNPENTDTVIINVGGTVFETYEATLKSLPTCRLSSDVFLSRYYRAEQGDYYFDRDPDKFKVVLNFLRNGELHVPTNMCGPAMKSEFEYWGIDEGDIEMCCWPYYNTWHAQSNSLEQLEKDMRITTFHEMAGSMVESKWKKIQTRVWDVLHNPDSSLVAKIYAYISVIAVLFSVFSFCVETHPIFQMHIATDIRPAIFTKHVVANKNCSKYNDTSKLPDNRDCRVSHPVLIVIDFTCLTFFTLEFLTRALFSPQKLKFLVSPLNIIDLVAIMPDYVELLMLFIRANESAESFVQFIFILRIIRICRIFRLIRHVPGLWILMYTLKASLKELLLMAVFLLIGMVLFASVIYYTERDYDFSNIPIGFWWSVVTMTTVGYGDLYPKTGIGYLVGSVCAMMGLLMIAFTVPIIVGNFVLYYTHVQHGVSRKAKKLTKDRIIEQYEWLFASENEASSCDVTQDTCMSNVKNGVKTDDGCTAIPLLPV